MTIDALNILFASAEESGADVVKGNNQICSSIKSKPASYNVNKDISLLGDELLNALFEHKVMRGHPWGKIFRRECLVDIKFPVGVKMTQDLRFMFLVMQNANKLKIIADNVYFYNYILKQV